jgi:monoamine oxidase
MTPQIVVIGAGAAGIGAGLMLHHAGVPHVILESKQRVGGRAYSESSSLGHLWDHGCHWLHSADHNVLREIAEKIGHDYLRQPRGERAKICVDGTWRTDVSRDDAWDALASIAARGKQGADKPAATALDSQSALYPFIRMWCQLMYAVDPEETSTLDVANYADSGVNLAVRGGYGALISRLAEGLPIQLGARAVTINVHAGGVCVETSQGIVQAARCILAIPVSQLPKLRVNPGLPSQLFSAAEAVPLGHAEKIAFAFEKSVFDPALGSSVDIQDGQDCITFELHPHGRPITIGHVGGSLARDLIGQGQDAVKEFALHMLGSAFGADIRRRVVASASTAWSLDPDIAGAYSAAKPGQALQRREFLNVVHDRIHLAGEHVHQSYMATCHGAFETGIFAAQAVLEAEGLPSATMSPVNLVG